MRLRETVSIFAGGEGSGCHGDNCGRPPVHEMMEKHEAAQRKSDEARRAKANVRLYKRRGDFQNAHRSAREAESAKSSVANLRSELKTLERQARHEEFGNWKLEKTEHSAGVGTEKQYRAPNGDRLTVEFTTGWAKQGVTGGYSVKLEKGSKTYTMSLSHGKDVNEFLKRHFGIGN